MRVLRSFVERVLRVALARLLLDVNMTINGEKPYWSDKTVHLLRYCSESTCW